VDRNPRPTPLATSFFGARTDRCPQAATTADQEAVRDNEEQAGREPLPAVVQLTSQFVRAARNGTLARMPWKDIIRNVLVATYAHLWRRMDNFASFSSSQMARTCGIQTRNSTAPRSPRSGKISTPTSNGRWEIARPTWPSDSPSPTPPSNPTGRTTLPLRSCGPRNVPG
jgi:hypothetical protein